jgi:tetratricopeptide (TPR) repeat protein
VILPLLLMLAVLSGTVQAGPPAGARAGPGSPAAAPAPDYFAPDRIYQFAEYLYRQGEYLRAAGEFERYLVLTGTGEPGELVHPHHDDSILFRIGRCYRQAKDPKTAIRYFERIAQGELVHQSPQSTLRDQVAYEVAMAYFEQGDYHRSRDHARAHFPQAQTFRTELLNVQIRGSLFLRDWQQADALARARNPGMNDSLASALDRLAFEAIRLPYKSKALAGGMSAVLPGAGKVYAGRVTDGLASLLLVGLTGWQAYDGFHRDGTRSVKGWIYGSLSAGFYLGDIWGSMVAVRQHNDRLEDDLLVRAAAVN